MFRKIELIGLPFAGGQSFSYHQLSRHLDERFTLLPMELPGRGRRPGEDFLKSLEAMTEDVYTRTSGRLRPRGYAVYGHSMGALLAHLLVHKIRREGAPPPLCLIVTGHGAPNTPLRHRDWHRLPDGKFIDRLLEFGGFPGEILRNREMMDYFLPILRADFKAYETFRHTPLEPLNIPILAMVGADEWATLANTRRWREMTTSRAQVLELPGNHFFILKDPERVAGYINDFIAASIAEADRNYLT